LLTTIRLAEGRGMEGPAPFVAEDVEVIRATMRPQCLDRGESRGVGVASIKQRQDDLEKGGSFRRV